MKSRHRLSAAAGLALLPLAAAIAASAASASQEPPAPSDAVSAGQRIFAAQCASCHGGGIGNPGLANKPGTDALRVKYNGDLPGMLEERTDLTPEVVALFVRQGVSIMPFYRKTEISDAELAQLGAYLSRNNPDLR